MGVDIFSSSGILFSLEEALPRFFKGISVANVKKLKSEIEPIIDNNKYKKSIRNVNNCQDLQSWFATYAESKIDKEEGYISDVILKEVWNKVIKLPNI